MRGFLAAASRLRAHSLTQLAVTGALSAIVGFTLQITKLSALDSSGRQFDQGTYAGKVGFLAVFGISKACANLSVGWLVTCLGYIRTELAGWLLGLAMPLTLALAATTGGASGDDGWRAVMVANVVLGLQQGLCWSVTVLVMILLMPDTRRGLASGLNETLGYAAVASAAPVYGVLESRMVRCGWVLPAAQISAACRSAAASAAADPSVVDDNGTQSLAAAAAAPAPDPHSCTSPDTWDPACLGECECRGYDRLLVMALLVLLPAGLAITALLLVEPTPAAATTAAAKYLPISAAAAATEEEEEEDGARKDEEAAEAGGRGAQRDWRTGGGGGGGGGGEPAASPGVVEQGRPAPRVPRAWLAALHQALVRRELLYDGSAYRVSYREQAETRRLLALEAPAAVVPSSTGGAGAGGGEAAATQAASLKAQGGAQRGASADGYEPLPAAAADGAVTDDVRPSVPFGMPTGLRKAAAAPAAFEVALCGDTADRRWHHQQQHHHGQAGSPCLPLSSLPGGDLLCSVRRFGRAFLHFTWHNPSTAAMCLAGATSNALTSLAWGLLLTWARDALGVPGPGRNLLTASYSFLKGLVQLLSGAVSDAAGRKAPVLTGLALNAAGLLTCACGAGWAGRLLGLGGGGGGAAAQRLLLVQYGYLMLGSCLMGAGAGVFYPVMPAAVVDHHHEGAPCRQQQRQQGQQGEPLKPLTERIAEDGFRQRHRQHHDDDDAADMEKKGCGDVGRREVGRGGRVGEVEGAASAREWERGREEGKEEVVEQERGGPWGGEHSMAAAMATYRFWRDLGYALGALGGPVADVVGVEATLVVAAAVCLLVAGVVMVRYEERVPVRAMAVTTGGHWQARSSTDAAVPRGRIASSEL